MNSQCQCHWDSPGDYYLADGTCRTEANRCVAYVSTDLERVPRWELPTPPGYHSSCWLVSTPYALQVAFFGNTGLPWSFAYEGQGTNMLGFVGQIPREDNMGLRCRLYQKPARDCEDSAGCWSQCKFQGRTMLICVAGCSRQEPARDREDSAECWSDVL
jgi:hypothetical protein